MWTCFSLSKLTLLSTSQLVTLELGLEGSHKHSYVNFKGISPVAVDASLYSMKTSYMLYLLLTDNSIWIKIGMFPLARKTYLFLHLGHKLLKRYKTSLCKFKIVVLCSPHNLFLSPRSVGATYLAPILRGKKWLTTIALNAHSHRFVLALDCV